jgi:hypothetical protein
MPRPTLPALAAATLLTALLGSASAADRSVTVTVPKSTAAVPVSYTLLQLRDTFGADFAAQWGSLKVTVGGQSLPYQIDDIDGNGRVSGPDELAFLANGDATLSVSDAAPAAPITFPAAMTATPKDDTTVITSAGSKLSAVVTKQGVVRLLDASGTVIADELGNLRLEGFNASTFYKDKNVGAYLEGKTTISGMTLTSLKVLPAGPVRTTVVARYASPDFVGIEQTLITRVYSDGSADVSNTLLSRGYADLMKVEHQASRLMTEVDPDATHIAPVPALVAFSDVTKQTPAAYFSSPDRKALQTLGGKPYLAFKVSQNIKPAFWGAPYLFVSPAAWRSNYSDKAKMGVAEIAHVTPATPASFTALVTGDQWQFESGELRTGVFRWLPDEFKGGANTAALLKEPNPFVAHYFPGDTINWRYLYQPYMAASLTDAASYLDARQAALAGTQLKK